jgi:ATP phosphoribosyltransferase
VESLPKPVNDKNGVAELSVAASNDGNTLHFTRDFKMKALLIETKYYPAVKNYFQSIQAGANEQAVLKIVN